MANQVNPLAIADVRNRFHIAPFVSGIMRTQVRERGRLVLVNDLIMVGSFRDGKQGLARFERLDDLQAYHDPTLTGDLLVELCKTARTGFADDVNGAADILTYQVPNLTPSFAYIDAGGTHLIKVTRLQYGFPSNGNVGGASHKVMAGTAQGKKVALSTGAKTLTLDNIGRLVNLKYTGNGTGPTVTTRRNTAVITYSGQPADQDKITITTITPKIFEFDSAGGVTAGNVAVAIGGDQDATFLALTNAINAQLGAQGVTAVHDATANTVTITAPQIGVIVADTTDTGNVVTVVLSGPAVALSTSITNPTDGSQPLNISLTAGPYQNLQVLVNFINQQPGYDAVLSPYADGALASTCLDPVTATSIASGGGGADLTGYVGAIVNAINVKLQGIFSAEALVYGTVPDEVLSTAAATLYTGGSSPIATIGDYQNAFTAIASQVELGGVLFVDSTDPAVLTMASQFVIEQQALGKWFRLYGALDAANPAKAAVAPTTVPDRIAAMLDMCGQIDTNLGHLAAQRMQIIGAGGELLVLSPLYLAAAYAGAAAGNVPFQRPLSNKRVRFAAIYPADEFTIDQIDQLLAGGITVVKKERDVIKVVLHVTTSHDSIRSMERVASERATVDLIDANVREAFLPFRGQWANADIAARVNGVLRQVLDRFVAAGALVAGVDEDGKTPVQPWQMIPSGPNGQPWVLSGGQVTISYQIFVGSELRGINLRGTAEYARLSGTLVTSALKLTTTVPLQ